MNWNDLKQAWERQQIPEAAAPVDAMLEQEFATRQRKLSRSLFWRDVREAAAGVFVAAVFARAGWQMGRHGWPMAFAVLLMLVLSGFFVWERVRVRQSRPEASAPLLTRLDAEIGEVRRQCRLLRSVAVWYVAPCVAAGTIFGVVVSVYSPLPVIVRAATLVAMIAICVLCGWGVVWLNRRAVRRGLEPRLRQLEELRNQLVDTP